MSGENKAIMRRIYEVFNSGNLEELDPIVDVNAVEH